MGVCAACHLDNAMPEHFHTRRHLGRKATADREYKRVTLRELEERHRLQMVPAPNREVSA